MNYLKNLEIKTLKINPYKLIALLFCSVTKFVKGELIDSASICQFCMEPMEVLRPGEGFTTFMHGSENICKK